MIEYCEKTDIYKYDSECRAIVVPVNCRGVLGAGAALAFKQAFPDLEHHYTMYCKSGLLKPGKMLYIPSDQKRPAIICLATKDHWRDPSKLEWIEKGLYDMRNFVEQCGLNVIRMPQVGCGLGGLEWAEVKKLIERIFKDTNVLIQVYIYAPKTKRR